MDVEDQLGHGDGVLAHLNKGETYTALAAGFGVGTTTVFRYDHRLKQSTPFEAAGSKFDDSL